MSGQFRVGQKVVCIEPQDDPEDPNPVVGCIYTVSIVYVADGDVMIDLVELPNPDSDEFYRGYQATAFRPIVERKTPIAIFHEILKTQRVRADA